MCNCTINTTTVKWEPLKMAELLRLLKPVESSWKILGRFLLRDELQYKMDTIESTCFHDDTSTKALDHVWNKWLERTARPNWQTLCDAAKKYGDDSLENYIEMNGLESEFI